jgi:hypothetical protein
MYERLEERTEGPVVGFRLSESISEADFESIADALETTIDEYGFVRLYLESDGYPRPDLDILDDDIQFWREHGDDLDRYVIVGEGTFLDWSVELGDRLTGIDMEFFEFDEREEAWQWVTEGLHSS